MNGSMGTVKEIVWSADPTKLSVPEFIVIDFPEYHGPVFEKWSKDPTKRTWVPIAPVNETVDDGKKDTRGPVLLGMQMVTWRDYPEGYNRSVYMPMNENTKFYITVGSK